jgi:hypothetical protein
MRITAEELTRRMAEADRKRVALRRATLELGALGRQLLAQRSPPDREPLDRSRRTDRRPPGRPRGA